MPSSRADRSRARVNSPVSRRFADAVRRSPDVRIITLNVNGIRVVRAQGLRALARARRAVGRRLPAGNQGDARRRPAPARARRASAHAAFLPAERKGYSGVAVYAKVPPRIVAGFGSPEFDAEGRYLEAHFAGADRHQRLPAVGIERPAPAGVEVPLPRANSCRISRASQSGARDHPLRRLEHRAPRDRSQELAQQPEELGLSAGGARVAHARVRRARASSTSSAAIDPRPDRTRGGRTAGRRGRRTSAGASTTRSPPPGSPRRRRPRRSTRNRRFSDHAPLIIDYDYELR